MEYVVEGKYLIITIDADEQRELQDRRDEDPAFDSDSVMYDVFEPLVANSELDWVDPSVTGDLTGAPILGYPDALENRWGFMDYALRSPQSDLAGFGRAVFIGA